MSEDEKKEEEKKDPEIKEDDDKKSATIADIKKIVPDLVRSIMGTGDKKEEDSGDDKDGDESGDKRPTSRMRTVDVFEMSKQMVRDQIEKAGLLKENEELKAKKEEKKEAPVEKAPVKYGRSTKFWLGSKFFEDDK